jgi:phosphoribosyl-ATP pyrophosphohydrolase
MAAEHEGKDELAAEVAQLLYHLQVMMVARNIDLEDVYRAL